VYKVILHRNAAKSYENADEKLRERIGEAIGRISKSPSCDVHIQKLRGELSHMYRYRMGGMRILFEIHEDIGTVRIIAIETRGGAYG
jgi:mRNA-degrading endonuclease RelE of RelBE toxin-antitoxin system